MPSPKKKDEKKPEDTKPEAVNAEPTPTPAEKCDKTIHVWRTTFNDIHQLRDKIQGTNQIETYDQVVVHLLSIYHSVRRMLVCEDESILEYTINDVDIKMKRMADAEEEQLKKK